MKTLVAVLLLLLHGSVARAAEIVCPSESSLAGEFETQVAKGFTANKLHIRKSASGYVVSLDSYWAPKPFDDGTLGTIGNFEGELTVPRPWSCTGYVQIRTAEGGEQQQAPACFLLLRFTNASMVEVTALGQCEYFHGNRATPAGSYVRRRA